MVTIITIVTSAIVAAFSIGIFVMLKNYYNIDNQLIK